MAVKITIPSPLQQYTDNQETVDVEAKTVGEALSRLAARHEAVRRHLFADDQKVRPFVNVYLDDEDVRFLQKGDTPVGDNDVLAIVPSIAGGS